MAAGYVFLGAASRDLELLILLHDRELDARILIALGAGPLEAVLETAGLAPEISAAAEQLDAAILALGGLDDPATLDTLAADYAGVYLTHSFGASPHESVWFDDEGIERQVAMFQVRQWIRRLGLRLDDPESRPEDHLVNQLRLAVHLLDCATHDRDPESRDTVARFLDEHLLRWLPMFAERLNTVHGPPFYTALADLTVALLVAARDGLSAEGAAAPPDPDGVARILNTKKRLSEFKGYTDEPGCTPDLALSAGDSHPDLP